MLDSRRKKREEKESIGRQLPHEESSFVLDPIVFNDVSSVIIKIKELLRDNSRAFIDEEYVDTSKETIIDLQEDEVHIQYLQYVLVYEKPTDTIFPVGRKIYNERLARLNRLLAGLNKAPSSEQPLPDIFSEHPDLSNWSPRQQILLGWQYAPSVVSKMLLFQQMKRFSPEKFFIFVESLIAIHEDYEKELVKYARDPDPYLDIAYRLKVNRQFLRGLKIARANVLRKIALKTNKKEDMDYYKQELKACREYYLQGLDQNKLAPKRALVLEMFDGAVLQADENEKKSVLADDMFRQLDLECAEEEKEKKSFEMTAENNADELTQPDSLQNEVDETEEELPSQEAKVIILPPNQQLCKDAAQDIVNRHDPASALMRYEQARMNVLSALRQAKAPSKSTPITLELAKINYESVVALRLLAIANGEKGFEFRKNALEQFKHALDIIQQIKDSFDVLQQNCAFLSPEEQDDFVHLKSLTDQMEKTIQRERKYYYKEILDHFRHHHIQRLAVKKSKGADWFKSTSARTSKASQYYHALHAQFQDCQTICGDLKESTFSDESKVRVENLDELLKSQFPPVLKNFMDAIEKKPGCFIAMRGGAIRDILNGKVPRDFDFRTNASIEWIQACLRASIPKSRFKKEPNVSAYDATLMKAQIHRYQGWPDCKVEIVSDTGFVKEAISLYAERGNFNLNNVFVLSNMHVVDPMGKGIPSILSKVVSLVGVEEDLLENPIWIIIAIDLAINGHAIPLRLKNLMKNNLQLIDDFVKSGRYAEGYVRAHMDKLYSNRVSVVSRLLNEYDPSGILQKFCPNREAKLTDCASRLLSSAPASVTRPSVLPTLSMSATQ